MTAPLAELTRLLPRRSDYDRRTVRGDLLAGATVAVVALPLALGFGVTSGAGAAAGLTTAIVAGIVAALFGGSRFQVSGPTGAMTVVLLPIVARHGVAALAPLGALAGLFLLVLAVTRVGRVVRYVPFPVVTGFTAGIAVIIALQQVPTFLGVGAAGGEQVLVATARVLVAAPTTVTWHAPALGLLTAAVMVLWGRVAMLRAVPASMAALLAATIVSLHPAFATVARVSAIPAGLPTPSVPGGAGMELTDLVRAALVIAVLAAIESLLSAVVADGMTISDRHDPDRELLGQGLANLASAVFGGIPATAALARTATNVHAGARTRLAAITHGVVLLGIVLAFAPLAERIPLPVLAGILIVVAARMVDRDEVRMVLRATRSDAVTMLLTFAVTVAFDLILALEVGLVAAGVLFVARMGRLLEIDPSAVEGTTTVARPGEDEHAVEGSVPRDLVVFRIDGPVFFGAADRFFEELLRVDPGIRAVVLRMRGVPVMDATGASALHSLVERLRRRGILVLVSGLQPQPHQVLERSGILAEVARDGDPVAPTDEAIARARTRLDARRGGAGEA